MYSQVLQVYSQVFQALSLVSRFLRNSSRSAEGERRRLVPSAEWLAPTTPSTPRLLPSSRTSCSRHAAARVSSVSTPNSCPRCATTTKCDFCVKVSRQLMTSICLSVCLSVYLFHPTFPLSADWFQVECPYKSYAHEAPKNNDIFLSIFMALFLHRHDLILHTDTHTHRHTHLPTHPHTHTHTHSRTHAHTHASPPPHT